MVFRNLKNILKTEPFLKYLNLISPIGNFAACGREDGTKTAKLPSAESFPQAAGAAAAAKSASDVTGPAVATPFPRPQIPQFGTCVIQP